MDPRPGAAASPPVVVVVVSRDPTGERLETLLEALAAQDYPSFRVLVADAGSRQDPAPLVADLLPDARVLHIGGDEGFGASANHVLDFVEGAALYVFSHDDVVPQPDALSALVAVAVDYEAGVVGPKLVDWDDPARLSQMGMASDRIGTVLPYVEAGELDQAQHDGLRDVFVVPGAFTLVRADLFARIGGFDESVTFLGDDLSLCWRARLAGAPVLVTSDAVVGHAEAMTERRDARTRRGLADRHRLRALLMCVGLLRLALVVPRALAVTFAQVVGALVTGRAGWARDAAGAWVWNARRARSLLVARRHVRRIRQVPDRQVARSQVRGLVGPRLQLRRLGGEAEAAPAAAGPPVADPTAWTPTTVGVAAVLVAVLVFGSRHLLTRFVPAVGELVPLDVDPGALVAEWASGWRSAGLGGERAAPTAVGALGLLGWLAGGGVGLLRTALTFGMIPVGIVGAHRLLRPVGSRPAQLAAAIAYAVAPVGYNALSGGHWSGLAAYAAAPWLLGRLARAAAMPPYAPGADAWSPVAHRLRLHVVAVGAVTAVTGLLVPAAPTVMLLTAAGLAGGSLLAAEGRGVRRLAAAAAGGAAVALALHLPVTLDLVADPGRLDAWLGDTPTGDLGMGDLLRFETGAFGAGPAGFALAVAALLPLLVGRSWRLSWGARGWGVAVVCWMVALAGQEGWTGLPLPGPEVLLAPAACGLAVSVAFGLVAFETDVATQSARLGARRLVSGAALVALAVGAMPIGAATLDGWWRMPRGDYRTTMASVRDDVADTPSRILWLGDPQVLPGGPGWAWRDGLAYATSLGGVRGVRDLWPADPPGATARLARALDLAAERRTSRLGGLLAPMAVQYVAVAQRPAPVPATDEIAPVPPRILDVLGAQLDLEEVRSDRAVTLYRNTVFAPARALLPDAGGLDGQAVGAARDVSLADAYPVLPEPDGVGYRGTLPPGQALFVGSTTSDRWHLDVAGESSDRDTALGWANVFVTGPGGEAELSYRSSPWFRAALVVQVLAWLGVLVVVLRMRFGAEPVSPRVRGRRPAASPSDAHGHGGEAARGGDGVVARADGRDAALVATPAAETATPDEVSVGPAGQLEPTAPVDATRPAGPPAPVGEWPS